MAPDWSYCLELLREMDLLCFCPGKGSQWAGVPTLPQPYSPVHNVCVPESLPPSPAAHQQRGEELSWTQQLPLHSSLLLPIPPSRQGSWALLNIRYMNKALLCTLGQVCRPQHTSQDLFCCVYMESLLVQICSTDHVMRVSQISWACIM